MQLLIAFVGILGCISAAPNKGDLKLPAFVKTCQRDQPDFDDCLKNALQDIFPYLAKGVREMDLPPIDPLSVEEGLYEFENGFIQSKSIVKDAYAYGLSAAKFSAVRTNFQDPNNIQLETEFFIPFGRVEGIFKQKGKVANTEFAGKGNFNITGLDMNVKFSLTGTLISKNNKKYLNIKHFVVTPVPRDMMIDADNLFNGNEIVSKSLVSFVNQYWRVMYDEMLPYSQEVWDKIFRAVANRFFLRVPFDDIFPSSQ